MMPDTAPFLSNSAARLSAGRIAFGALAAAGWLAIISQTLMFLLGAGFTLAGLANVVILLLTFFTIVTNLAIAIAATAIAWRFDSAFSRPRIATALAVYATIVLAVYELMLRRLWHPHGLGLVVDTIFHDIVPVAFVTLWWCFIRKGTLRAADALPWLIAPALYAVWIGILGLIFGGSPYPFLNVATLGGGRVAVNIAVLIGIFWLVGLAYVALDGWGGRLRRVPNHHKEI